jgi:hypothetical protein
LDEEIELVVRGLVAETVAKLGAATVLDGADNGVDPEEEEFVVGEVLTTLELGLEGCGIR